MNNIERGPRPDVQFDPEQHVKIPEGKFGSQGEAFVGKEAYKTAKLAEVAAVFNVSRKRGEANEQNILENEARKENKKYDEEHNLSENQKIAKEIRAGRKAYRDLSEDQKRDLDILFSALDHDARDLIYVPADLQDRIKELAGKG